MKSPPLGEVGVLSPGGRFLVCFEVGPKQTLNKERSQTPFLLIFFPLWLLSVNSCLLFKTVSADIFIP